MAHVNTTVSRSVRNFSERPLRSVGISSPQSENNAVQNIPPLRPLQIGMSNETNAAFTGTEEEAVQPCTLQHRDDDESYIETSTVNVCTDVNNTALLNATMFLNNMSDSVLFASFNSPPRSGPSEALYTQYLSVAAPAAASVQTSASLQRYISAQASTSGQRCLSPRQSKYARP